MATPRQIRSSVGTEATATPAPQVLRAVRRFPRVSIGLPVYNGAQFLAETIESLLAQTFTDFELIISDNASTDATAAICESYAQRDARIRYYRADQNRGGIWNYNRVFELARGTYFKWQAHDDTCAPGFVERCVAVLDHHPQVEVCFSHTLIIDEHSQTLQQYNEQLHLRSQHAFERLAQYHRHDRDCPLCSVYFGLMRRDTLAQTGLMRAYVNSEFTLMSELALLGEFYELPEHLFMRRDHPQISTRAYTTIRERMAWVDPAQWARGKGAHPGWQMLFDQLRAVLFVPMPVLDRLRCLLVVGQFLGWLVQGSLQQMLASLRQCMAEQRGSVQQ